MYAIIARITKATNAPNDSMERASMAKCSIPRLKQLPTPAGQPCSLHHEYLSGSLIVLNIINTSKDAMLIPK